jgi:hypothetical protein
MRRGEATLRKRSTDDDLFNVLDHIELGKRYVIDLDSRMEVTFFNTEHRVHHVKEIVMCWDGQQWAPFPTEMLDITDTVQ